MNIQLSIEASEDRYHKVIVNVDNGLCKFSGFDLLTLDRIEDLEIELTIMIQSLQRYRSKMEYKDLNNEQ